jgi:hypothetical protein
VIGRVRATYDQKHAGFTSEGASIEAPNDIAGLLREGFVELLGEVNPQPLEEIFHNITPPKANPEKDQQSSQSPQYASPIIYEYFWSVGMSGADPKWYDQLDEHDPIIVQLILHTKGSRYVTQDVAANLKQVPPFQKTTENKIQDWFAQLQPVVETAGKVLSIGGAKVPGEILSAISQMKLNTVPVDQFPWWVKTFSTVDEAGVEWHIPKKLVQYVGNRLVGSFGVYLIKCGSEESLKDEFSIELRAYLRSRGLSELYISPTNTRTELIVKPKTVNQRLS